MLGQGSVGSQSVGMHPCAGFDGITHKRQQVSSGARPVSAAILYAALACSTPALAADLPVRFGAHPTFDRMVFDWREPTE